LIDDEPTFVWSSIVLHFGLPALPEWADWFLAELQSRKRMQPMDGLRPHGNRSQDESAGAAEANRTGTADKETGISPRQWSGAVAGQGQSNARQTRLSPKLALYSLTVFLDFKFL